MAAVFFFLAYQPAALDRAADSIKGVSTQGFGSSSCFVFAILIGGSVCDAQ